MDRAGAQDDAPGPDVDPVVPGTDPDPDGTARFDEHPFDGGAADDPQIRPLACRLQVRVVGCHAGPVTALRPNGETPVAVGAL